MVTVGNRQRKGKVRRQFWVWLGGCIAVFASSYSVAYANPVSFKDGWGVMPSFGTDWADLDLNYSTSSREAIGASFFYRSSKNNTSTFGILRKNYLIKRWNQLESQGNIYGSFGIGAVDSSQHGAALAGYGALEADFETRRIYLLAGAESLQSDEVQFNRIRTRVGVAPYLASFEGLHTWLITQVDFTPEMDREVSVTPLIRLFYQNFALEVGVSLKGEPFTAFMAHF